jgi:transposase InsO family protein
VLDKIHKTVYSGHLGKRKTYRKVQERFYRPELKQEVYEYVKTYDICQKIKSTIPNRSELIPIMPTRTNELVSTDYAGPFKTTVRGNKYIIVIVDCLGKYLVRVPVPDKETTTAARALLDHWCWIFGIPERILSDRGKEFRSKIWDSICELLDIDRVKTTPWHPQGDGQSEKSVQQIKKMIRAHVDEDQESWN